MPAGTDLKGSGSELAILRALWWRPGLLDFLCESRRTNLGCTYWMKALYVLWMWAFIAIFSGRTVCVCMVFVILAVLKLSLLYSIPSSQLSLKKRNWKWSCVNAAAKALPCRTSYPNVLWEDTWGAVWKLMMDIQILYPLRHIHMTDVQLRTWKEQLTFGS